MLSGPKGEVITDFEGNPLSTPEEHSEMQSPAKDAASFLRSIDHLRQIASQRRPGRGDEIERWVATSACDFSPRTERR